MLRPGEVTAMVSFKPLSVLRRSGASHLLPTLERTKLREADQLHKGAKKWQGPACIGPAERLHHTAWHVGKGRTVGAAV